MVNKLEHIARKAGKEILKWYDVEASYEQKSDNSPLTKADLASHRSICKDLAELTPEIPVLSEESEVKEVTTDTYWLVDPLDGTKEFIKKTGEFTVNIALMKHGQPHIAVIYAPVPDLLYHAEIGSKAYKIESGKKIEIRCRITPEKNPVLVASKDHAGLKVKQLKELLNTEALQSIGSSFKFMLIAEGKADYYLRDKPTMEWDIAAAHCILKVAGGEVYQMNGDIMLYQKPNLRNPAFFAIGDTSSNHKQLLMELGY